MTTPKLLIEVQPDGSVNVSGPLTDKILCYGMLEAARDAIRDYKADQRIMAAPPSLVIPPS